MVAGQFVRQLRDRTDAAIQELFDQFYARIYRYLVRLVGDPQTAADAPTFSNQLDLFWFYRAVDRAPQGADLERELHDAQFLTEQYLACVRGGERARTCATTVDAEYDGFAAD
jgi:hypothetical protein